MQIGIFSIASYPYSFKLLWSPVVDSVYSGRFGRRKSWIVPLQLLSAALMFLLASWADARLQARPAELRTCQHALRDRASVSLRSIVDCKLSPKRDVSERQLHSKIDARQRTLQ